MRPPFHVACIAYLAPFGPRTKTGYLAALRHWVTSCTTNGFDPWECRRYHIEVWWRRLLDYEHYARRTVAGMLTPVCGVYDYAHAEQWLDLNPAAHVRRPRVPAESSTNGLTRDELLTVLDLASVYDDPHAGALIHVLGLNGTRIGETLKTDIEDVGTHGEFRTIKLCRKGDKPAVLSLADYTARSIDRSIGNRRSGPLFLGPSGARMTSQQARVAMNRIAARVGITRRVTPHSLRHTFVTLSRDAGIPDRDIMASTGHLTAEMLEYYDRNRIAIERNATHGLSQWLGITTPTTPANPEAQYAMIPPAGHFRTTRLAVAFSG